MKFKDTEEPVVTDDPYYDLFEGGYIKPDQLLEEEDAAELRQAIKLVQKFLRQAELKGCLVVA